MARENENKLTPKQDRFCQEYLIDLNATQAAIRAGYSEKTANVIASENLAKPYLQARIAELKAKREQRTEITQDKVLSELAKMGFANMDDYTVVRDNGDIVHDFSGLTRDQAAAITEVTTETYLEGRGDDAERVKRVRLKLSDKKGALELIGKHLGMFPNKTEVSGPDGGPIRYADMSDAELIAKLKSYGIDT